MTRQTITLTAINDEWLKNQVKGEEFSSKSEAINYFIRQARTVEEYNRYVRQQIEIGEKSGTVTENTIEEIFTKLKEDN